MVEKPVSSVAATIVILAIVSAACSTEAPKEDARPAQESTAEAEEDTGQEATAPRMPDRLEPVTAPPSEGCVKGWRTPERDDPLVDRALRLIRRTMGVKGGFSLQDFRYFTGPESPPSDKGYILEVERWYVKGHLKRDPSFRGRWLVERRTFGAGVVAAAPYETEGFRSPDWRGFQHEANTEPKPVEGLPGVWAGTPYDFVEGGAGLTFPGLPEEVQDCLAGT